MRRKSDKNKKVKAKRKPDPDWFEHPIEPDLFLNTEEEPEEPQHRRDPEEDEARIKKIIIRKVKEEPLNFEDMDPHDELVDLELKINRIRYTMFIERWKISKKHSTKEYCV